MPSGENWDRTDYYHNSAGQVLEERFAAGQANKETLAAQARYEYVWGVRYVHAPVLRDADTDSDGDCTDSGGSERLYYAGDANFNLTALVGTDGAVVERYWYEPYGRVHILEPDWDETTWAASKKNELLFTGHRWDPETGLYGTLFRPYHPTVGRWCQRDTDYFDGMSLCEYARSSPVDRADPLGRWVSGPPLEDLMPGHTTLMTNGLNSVPALAARLYELYRKAAIDGNLSMDQGYGNLKYMTQGFTDEEAEKHFMVGQKSAGGRNHPSRRVREAAAQQSMGLIRQNLLDCLDWWMEGRRALSPKQRGDLCQRGWRSLGMALHTLQDAFAHTDRQGLPLTSHEHGGTLVGEFLLTKETVGYQLLLKWHRRDNPALNRARFQAAQQATNAVIGAVWPVADGPVGCNCIEKPEWWGPI